MGLAIKTTVAMILIVLIAVSTASVANANMGTRLTASSNLSNVECIDSQKAVAEIVTTVTSTGSVDSAEIRTSIDSAADWVSGWIEPQDFQHAQRIKTAATSFTAVFENGQHTVSSCYVQSGSDGRILKRACAQPVSFEVRCQPDDPCAGEQAFGNIIGNGNLCAGQVVPIHLKGAFGDSVVVIISKDSFSKTITLDRSGESCVYQGKYVPGQGHGGAGLYVFSAIGENGNTYSFTAQLKCR